MDHYSKLHTLLSDSHSYNELDFQYSSTPTDNRQNTQKVNISIEQDSLEQDDCRLCPNDLITSELDNHFQYEIKNSRNLKDCSISDVEVGGTTILDAGNTTPRAERKKPADKSLYNLIEDLETKPREGRNHRFEEFEEVSTYNEEEKP